MKGGIRANQYSDFARLEKALALADVLDGAQIGSRAAAGMNEEQWHQVASACRVILPSPETQKKTIEMLQAREAVRERMFGKDPFTVIKGGRR